MGLLRVTLQRAHRRPSRLLLTGCALIVTTFFLAGSVVFGSTFRDHLVSNLSSVAENTDVVVHPGTEGPLTDEDLRRITDLPAVDSAQPTMSGRVLVQGRGRDAVRFIGTTMQGPQALSQISSGTAPTLPDEVALPAGMAEQLGKGVGDQLSLLPGAATGTPHAMMTVSAVLETSSVHSNAILTTPDIAAEVLNSREWDKIDITGTDARAVNQALAGEAIATSGPELRAQQARSEFAALSSVLALLGSFVAVAMLGAAVIVSSTFRVLLTSDQRQLALLRCLGARPGHVLRSVLTEAALSGLIAGALGAAAAAITAHAGLGIARAGGFSAAPQASTPVGLLLLCVLVTVVLAIAAAMPAAWAAARTSPVSAMSTATTRNTGSHLGGKRLTLGAVLLLAALGSGAIARWVATEGDNGLLAIFASVGSGIILFCTILAWGPLLLRSAVPVLRLAVRLLGRLPGALALSNLTRVPRRSAACAAVVMLGTTMVCAVLVVLASMEAGGHSSIEERYPYDAVVYDITEQPALLTPEVVESVRHADGVGLVVAHEHGSTRAGEPETPSTLRISLAEGADLATLRASLESAVPLDPALSLSYPAESRNAEQALFGQLRVVAVGLVGITVLVSLIGVAITLMLSVVERTHESGVLRALGLRGSGLRRILGWEAGVLAVYGLVPSVLLGVAYGALVLLGLGELSIFTIPYGQLLVTVACVLGMSLAAAALPAWRTARTSPMNALRRE